MEFKATAEIKLPYNDIVIYDVFEVDTGTYFAHPRVPHQQNFQEFYFSKVGHFWEAEPSPYHVFALDRAIQALGFVFTNKYPSAEQSKNNMTKYHIPAHQT